MEKEKIVLPIGSKTALVFKPDPGNKEDQDFAKRCKEVAATQPQSIQEFFTRLNELQKNQPTETTQKAGRKL